MENNAMNNDRLTSIPNSTDYLAADGDIKKQVQLFRKLAVTEFLPTTKAILNKAAEIHGDDNAVVELLTEAIGHFDRFFKWVDEYAIDSNVLYDQDVIFMMNEVRKWLKDFLDCPTEFSSAWYDKLAARQAYWKKRDAEVIEEIKKYFVASGRMKENYES